MKRFFLPCLLALGACTVNAGTLVDLSVEVSLPATNDMVRANLYSEVSGANPALLAKRINSDISEALKLARGTEGVKVQSGAQNTYPVYNQAQKLESWRMRSEIVLESRDQAAVASLIGQLQGMRLAVGSVSLLPSPEKRKQVSDQAILEAVRAFQQRAALVAGELGKTWKIRQINVNQANHQPQPMLMQARGAMYDAAAPMPLEAGESQVTASINGQVELAD
ncbi:MAG: SIMPL domain-containing protein [Rhodocyclales bacterium]|nr:SIMPL domain-containing protein [Rhodocyclales bacterium]